MRILLLIILFGSFVFAGDNGKIIVGNQKKIFSQDASTNAINTINYEHHEVHSGSHYTYSKIDADFDIADADTILIITPNITKWCHMIIDVEAALNTNIKLYENTAAAGYGSASVLTAYNNKAGYSSLAVAPVIICTPGS
ncbi:unnamed protein product [marine sediment metagenome]|uniref:Uncharacterized protein n=1 Tax=marine sediment metagenome TaxID=412755 RepID=X1BDC7_9ZZZZ